MTPLKPVLLSLLLSAAPALASGSKPSPAPCSPLDCCRTLLGPINAAVVSACPVSLPPVCPTRDPKCPLFWLIPVYA